MSEQPGFLEKGGDHTPVGSRRRFFAWVTRVASGLIGLGLAIPLVGYVVSPALKRRAQSWVEVGRLDTLPEGEPTQLEYVTIARDGYMEAKTQKAVWAVKQPDGAVTVFAPLCTHLGCGYNWDKTDHRFKCPCHGSVYDVTGAVLAGPAPRALDRLPVQIEDGRVLVMYKEFKAGLSKTVEL
ncbi:MAG: ubiquinol-cytochrome c reductase iron-sulfur subunit [Nitrospirota bacterium]|nr:ubiquinol-cytochrome c reductase iron-sulfur subunit [Nitrospirota bacterium]